MVTVEFRRPAVVKLDVGDDAHQLLQQTIDRFKQAAQMVADDGWNGTEDGYIVTSKTELHDRTRHRRLARRLPVDDPSRGS
ncbi:hypothetical protein PNP85_05615 [Halobacterium salinarum]|uniref:hypothetical protein n=1 Tax=Halobacteriales TaxID=2235 RepID=UPI0019D3271C|nr:MULTISPECIES: hypothetical protein [Halobacteria]MDL0138978.1 hypothetical protein [Halobacterium salinarum]